MASAPQQLPLFYNALEPLSSEAHAHFRVRNVERAPFLKDQHAIPLTVEEFPMVMRYMPIVFTQGPDPVPLALMALNEGFNSFVDQDGGLLSNDIYIPAYIRRYPYLLARLQPESDQLTLCFDPTSEAIGDFADGEPLFENGQPTAVTRAILDFNEQFEQGGAKTQAFMRELAELELLQDGQAELRLTPDASPITYQGFQMVNEEKLRDLRGDQLRKMVQSGMLPMIYAHLFSMQRFSEIYARQVQQGKLPPPTLPPLN
jgi:hypothetical protein